MLKNLPRRSAVSAVIERLPCTISLIRRAGTPMPLARRYWLMCIASRKSLVSTTPGWTGASLRLDIRPPINAPRYYGHGLPIAPARVQRKVQPAPRAAECRRVGVELGGIALLFPVQESFDVCPLVAAGLVIHHPPGSVRIDKQAIDHIAAIPRANAVFASRLGVRSKHPAALRVGDRVSQRGQHHLGRRFEFAAAHAAQEQLTAHHRANAGDPIGIPALELVLRDTLQP